MNKQYFTKYLPVEGEIKDGDIVLHDATGEKGTVIHIHPNRDAYEIQLSDNTTRFIHKGYLKRFKLFLCSRDNIQVSDKVYCPKSKPTSWNVVQWIVDGSVGVTIENSTDYSQDVWTPEPNEIFKVIGEISPDATWVKEGDEFDEFEWKKEEGFFETIRIKIKSPCGHFH